jgi:hypothetical protein
MKLAQIRKAKLIAQAFVNRADKVMDEAAKREQGDEYSEPSFSEYAYPSKSTGALRRCSMELTRQLAEMRKP